MPNLKNTTPIKYGAAGLAAVVLAFGAYAIGNSKSSNGTSGTASAAQTRAAAGSQNGGRAFPGGGQRPPGFGTPATGTAAGKAKAAALAKYSGTAERVLKLPDGSYVVHVLSSNGEYRVSVSKDFKVTGTQQGGPGARGVPGGGQPGATPPSGSSQPNGSTS